MNLRISHFYFFCCSGVAVEGWCGVWHDWFCCRHVCFVGWRVLRVRTSVVVRVVVGSGSLGCRSACEGGCLVAFLWIPTGRPCLFCLLK